MNKIRRMRDWIIRRGRIVAVCIIVATIARILMGSPAASQRTHSSGQQLGRSGLQRMSVAPLDPMLRRFREDPSAWDAFIGTARNRLGVDFSAAIIHPRALNEREYAALEKWQAEAPAWWNAIDQLVVLPDDGRHDEWIESNEEAAAMLTAMPLIMKSLAMRAAGEMAREEFEAAEKTLRAMERIHVGCLRGNDLDPWGRRIQEETWRIYSELNESASARSRR